MNQAPTEPVAQRRVNVGATKQQQRDGGGPKMKGKSKKKTKAAEVQQTYHVVEADAMAAVNLERLMQANVDLIAVDSKTGGLVGGLASSIMFGNFLHKTSVLSGIGCIVAGLVPRQDATKVMFPLGATSAAAAIAYGMFIQGDPLAHYQVDEVGAGAKMLPKDTLSPSTSYVMMVRRGNGARLLLHNGIGLTAAIMCLRRSPETLEQASVHARAVYDEVTSEGFSERTIEQCKELLKDAAAKITDGYIELTSEGGLERCKLHAAETASAAAAAASKLVEQAKAFAGTDPRM